MKELLALLTGRPLLTKQDLARRWSVTLRTIERRTAARTIPAPVRVAGPRWTPAAILKWERSHRV